MLNPNDIIHKFKFYLLFKIQVKTTPSTHKMRTQGFQLAMVSETIRVLSESPKSDIVAR